ncbi:MAG: cupin domain-containing protein [Ardenticatenaceae bacterium]|nr:cupin domain-containing protein [Anaerolineales bacterium]MCB8923315.1 cupin domain-containing protein [Ardenticatenaceae bacterium]MCB9004686.1 cupin domain-containing protein [Ardenticatenaceae bacterium]
MDLVKHVTDFVGVREEKFYKTTLFRTDGLMLGLNCLEPGQVQKPHDHADQDKFYYVVEGEGVFWLGEERVTAVAQQLIFAPAGLLHGVENQSDSRLTLLVGIAPAP